MPPIAALRGISGLEQCDESVPRRRFRPAPVLMLRLVRDNRRPAVVSAGAASPLAPPRSTCVPRSSHRSRDRAAHRDAASEVVPRATRRPNLANALLRDFRDLSRRRRDAGSQIGAVSARGVLFVFFAHLQLLFAALPFSRLAVDNICGVAAEYRTGKTGLSFGDYDYGAYSLEATAELAHGLNSGVHASSARSSCSSCRPASPCSAPVPCALRT